MLSIVHKNKIDSFEALLFLTAVFLFGIVLLDALPWVIGLVS